MANSIDSDLVKIGQGMFTGQTLNGELSLDLSKKSFAIKLLSTPMVQSSMLGTLGSLMLLFTYQITSQLLFAYMSGLCLIAVVFYVLLIPIYKPELTKSEVNIMFFAYIALIEKTLELPTSVGGQSLEAINASDELATIEAMPKNQNKTKSKSPIKESKAV